MAVNYNPKIVTSGLILCLDAANIKSYPGSGTTWTDLSGNNRNGTLTNGPTYVSTNSGRIVFDGSNDYVAISVNTVTSVTNSFTYNIWCMPTATHEIDTENNTTFDYSGTSGQKYVIAAQQSAATGGAGVSVGTNGVSVYEHGSSYMPALLVSTATISSTVMSNIAIVYNNKQPLFYLNGVLIRTGLTSQRTVYPVVYNPYTDTPWIGSGQYGSFQGSISHFGLYNRALSAAEVAQNFNTLRGRFGI